MINMKEIIDLILYIFIIICLIIIIYSLLSIRHNNKSNKEIMKKVYKELQSIEMDL